MSLPKEALADIHPVSKHLVYQFGFTDDVPTLFVDSMTLNLDSVGFDYYHDSELPTRECVIRGFHNDDRTTGYLIKPDKDCFFIGIFESSGIELYKREYTENVVIRLEFDIGAYNKAANNFGVCQSIYTKYLRLLNTIPNIQMLTSDKEFDKQLNWWILNFVLPYVVARKVRANPWNA